MADWGTQLDLQSTVWTGTTGVDTIVANAGDALVVSVNLAIADAPIVSIVSDLDGALNLEQFEGVDDCNCMGWLELSTTGTHTITVTPTESVGGYNAFMSTRRIDTNGQGFQFDATAGFQGKDVASGATSTDTDAITPNDSPCLYETLYAKGPAATGGDIDWDGATILDGQLSNSLLQATATSTLHTTAHANSASRRAVSIGAFIQDAGGATVEAALALGIEKDIAPSAVMITDQAVVMARDHAITPGALATAEGALAMGASLAMALTSFVSIEAALTLARNHGISTSGGALAEAAVTMARQGGVVLDGQAVAGAALALARTMDMPTNGGRDVQAALSLGRTIGVGLDAARVVDATLSLSVGLNMAPGAQASAEGSVALALSHLLSLGSDAVVNGDLTLSTAYSLALGATVITAGFSTPEDRTFRVSLELRTFRVSVDDRVFRVPADSRRFRVPKNLGE